MFFNLTCPVAPGTMETALDSRYRRALARASEFEGRTGQSPIRISQLEPPIRLSISRRLAALSVIIVLLAQHRRRSTPAGV